MENEAGFRHFRDLIVWKKAMELAREVYRATQSFPADERFGIVNQMRRAAVSIPSNIAEGQGRCTTGEFRQFLGHARGSLCELGTQAELAADLDFMPKTTADRLLSITDDVAKLLNALMSSLGRASSAREEPEEEYGE